MRLLKLNTEFSAFFVQSQKQEKLIPMMKDRHMFFTWSWKITNGARGDAKQTEQRSKANAPQLHNFLMELRSR
jgi:hypothetical protein